MFNNFIVTKKLSLSAFGFYRGKARTLQFNVDPMYFVNLGARYKLWDGKGTFSLNYSDIFNTMKFGFDGELPYVQKGESYRFQVATETLIIYVEQTYPIQ